MKSLKEPWIKMCEQIENEDYKLIKELQEQCIDFDKTALKLEIDYKLSTNSKSSYRTGIKKVNEFMYFDENNLLGYIGICSFGEKETSLEIMGMVHPQYRQQGIFSSLFELVLTECKKRNPKKILLLSDRKSTNGLKFIKNRNAIHSHSEFEMYLQKTLLEREPNSLCGVTLRREEKRDKEEISRQDNIYFGNCIEDEEIGEENDFVNVDAETSLQEHNGMQEIEDRNTEITFLAEKANQIVGKVRIETSSNIGGIYGLGVLPEHRGKGFGRGILLNAINKLRETEVKEIMLQVETENETALGLYKSCGFHETSIMDYYELKI
ncbi:MAG: GNAT family N-acetyltransferase [Lachnotalea sp.]